MTNCTTDDVQLERPNNVESWAEDYVNKHEKVDHYLASDFFEMALTGIFNNDISLSTVSTDSVYFYSDVYTAEYTKEDLVTIAKELQENLAGYYREKDILGNNVEIFQFKDKLLILSILKEKEEEVIAERSIDCIYTESHRFDNMVNCQNNEFASNALGNRFYNRESEGCYLEDIPDPLNNPTPWNYMYLYRNVPNPPSNALIFTDSCFVIDDCLDRINGTFNLISLLKCNNFPNDPSYCDFIDVPGNPAQKRLYITNVSNAACLSAGIMDQYQQRLADLANDLRDQNMYGLNNNWVPHVSLIFNAKNAIKKTHAVTFEYITYDYNPKNGHNSGGF